MEINFDFRACYHETWYNSNYVFGTRVIVYKLPDNNTFLFLNVYSTNVILVGGGVAHIKQC